MNRIMTGVIPALALGLIVVSMPGAAHAADGGRPTTVTLTGAAEAPGPGDPDGTATFHMTVNPGLGEICYTFTVSGVDPVVAAHIHLAPVGSPGPVVVPLVPPTSGSSAGCAAVPRALAKNILKHPGDYYVNVHNAVYPAGALRAQLG